MSKILFYSDTHLAPERLDALSVVYDKVGEIAEEHNAHIVCGGDTFDVRGTIHTSCLDFLHKKFVVWKKKKLKQTILVGNHDQEDRVGLVHAMGIFRHFDWNVVDQPMQFVEIPKFVFYPYIKDLTRDQILPGKGKIAVVHWGIRGAKRNDSNIDAEGVPAEWLSQYAKVYSGHYHYRNKFLNIQYIGDPLQKDFGEMGQKKGVILLDTKTGQDEFIEIKGTPQHFEVIVKFEDGKRIVEKPKGILAHDRVRVKVSGDIEQCAQVDREYAIKVAGTDNVTIAREPKEKHFSRLSIEPAEVHNVEALAKKYVDFVDTDLTRSRLLEMGRSYING